MANINNSDLTRNIIDGAKINTSIDRIPNQLAEKVVPVMETNPDLLRKTTVIEQGAATNTTSNTIYTTPSNKDFFLTGAFLALTKDANAVAITTRINFTVGGKSKQCLGKNMITLTADSWTSSVTFKDPIKIDRGTAITVTNDNGTANILATANIFGYTVED